MKSAALFFTCLWAATVGCSGEDYDYQPWVWGSGPFVDTIVRADSPPPPISGGTLIVLQGSLDSRARDGLSGRLLAALSDPDRDQVVIVHLDMKRVEKTIALSKGDEPGRLVEDDAGMMHVALRGAGAVVTIDPSTGTVVERRTVCSDPRGLAYDAKSASIHLACAGGELLTMPAAGGEPTRRLDLGRDLRDVVVDGDRLLVSRFRAAELLVVEADGHVSNTLRPSVTSDEGSNRVYAPAVAWRTVPVPGGAMMVFQEEQTSDEVTKGGYGNGGHCTLIVPAVSILRADGTSFTTADFYAVLPVDAALAPDGLHIVVAAAGATPGENFGNPEAVVTVDPPIITNPVKGPGRCDRRPKDGDPRRTGPEGQVVSVAFDAAGRLLVQTREPATLVVDGERILLPGPSVADTGHRLFHLANVNGFACASCHAEGHEDGHVWHFEKLRRTQSLRGHILGTEPFHWNGEDPDFETAVHQVLGSKPFGSEGLGVPYVKAMEGWVDQLAAPKPKLPTDAAAVDRGRTLFQDSTVGCTDCHAGSKLTNNKTVSVGTGEPLQVPSLIGVGSRAPFMHDGCATTLADRFGSCGGGEEHGHVATLSDAQRADLVSYLESL
jgi:mono/diheme cytochrome c family protein